jgi:hypothetical protein
MNVLKSLFVLALALTLSVGTARSQSNLVITADGGASNITSTGASLGLNIVSTNSFALRLTNYWGWGTVEATNILANWQHIFTNSAQTNGVIQTNLTGLAVNTLFYYRPFAQDASNGMVNPGTSIAFRTLVGGIHSNSLFGYTNIVVAGAMPGGIGTLTVNGLTVGGGGAGTTNLQTILATGPQAGNMTSQVISNGTITNVTIQSSTASNLTIQGSFAPTNGFISSLPTQTTFYASQYLTNNGTAIDTGGLTNLLNAAKLNAKIIWPALTALITFDTNILHGYIYYGTNVEWSGGGQTLNFTNVYLIAGSSLIDLRNVTGLYVHDMNFSMPPIATNNSTINTILFSMNGTNTDIHFENCDFNGGHWDFAAGIDLPSANYNWKFSNITVSNAGCYGCGDGGFFEGTGRNMLCDGLTFTNGYRVWETYNPVGGQADPGNIKVINVSVKDMQHDGYIDPSGGGAHLDSLVLENWTFETTLPVSTLPFYGVGNAIMIRATRVADVRNVVIKTNGINNGANLNALVDSNLTVAGFHGRANGSADEIAGPNFSIQDSELAVLTVDVNSTGSVHNVGSASLANSGFLSFIRDGVGNVTAQGAGTFNSGLVIGNSIVNGNNNQGLLLNGGFVGNNQVISNGGTISTVIANTNLLYFIDTSVAGFTNTVGTTGTTWQPNQIVTLIKSNVQQNSYFLRGSSAARVNTYNGQQIMSMSNRWDTITFFRGPDSILNIIGGNFWSNLNVSGSISLGGSNITSWSQVGASSHAITNWTSVTTSTLQTNPFNGFIKYDCILFDTTLLSIQANAVNSNAMTTNYGASVPALASVINPTNSISVWCNSNEVSKVIAAGGGTITVIGASCVSQP